MINCRNQVQSMQTWEWLHFALPQWTNTEKAIQWNEFSYYLKHCIKSYEHKWYFYWNLSDNISMNISFYSLNVFQNLLQRCAWWATFFASPHTTSLLTNTSFSKAHNGEHVLTLVWKWILFPSFHISVCKVCPGKTGFAKRT